MKVSILGAGPCGLGAAYQLNELKLAEWNLYERDSKIGGLSASFLDEAGFTWDIGGHVLFSHYPYFDEVVEKALAGEYYEHLRESWVRILDRWVPYPFQNNIRHLPGEVLSECLDGLQGGGAVASDASFREWMEAIFGCGIVRYFMEPYNRKVWGVPLEQMSKDWIAERVSVVDRARIERNIAEERDDVNWGPNNRFKFPKRGGTGAIFEGIGRPFMDRIRIGEALVSVNLGRKELTFSSGLKDSFDHLITTIPLDLFVGMCEDAPENVRDAAGLLVHNSGLIVGLGFRGERKDSKCWMYFPEENCPFYRVTNFHNYSPHNLPGGRVDMYFSLMCETTYSDHKPVDKNLIIEETIRGLVSSGMITKHQKDDIVSSYLIDIPYSYPVPTQRRDEALAAIQPFLESHNVYSRGRFGAWKYEVGNMDHSFMQGVEVVRRILDGIPERTVKGQV